MTTKAIHHYGEQFNTNAAEIMVPFLLELFPSKSVVDIGCGTGTWLKVFQQKGITDFFGVDGKHVTDFNQLEIPKENFKEQDLRYLSYNDIQRTFDLAVCLEVAEHLDETYADNFVKALCSLSKILVFSAAIPGQFGENHFNEQYPGYWVAKFKQHGYVFTDIIRPKYWNNTGIEWWYRQNTFIVVEKSIAEKHNFSIWDEKVYVIKDLLEMYVQLLDKRKTNNTLSIRSLPRRIFRQFNKKITW